MHQDLFILMKLIFSRLGPTSSDYTTNFTLYYLFFFFFFFLWDLEVNMNNIQAPHDPVVSRVQTPPNTKQDRIQTKHNETQQQLVCTYRVIIIHQRKQLNNQESNLGFLDQWAKLLPLNQTVRHLQTIFFSNGNNIYIYIYILFTIF